MDEQQGFQLAWSFVNAICLMRQKAEEFLEYKTFIFFTDFEEAFDRLF